MANKLISSISIQNHSLKHAIIPEIGLKGGETSILHHVIIPLLDFDEAQDTQVPTYEVLSFCWKETKMMSRKDDGVGLWV